MHSNDRLPEEAAHLLKIYLSGGSLPGNVNPLVLIEMAKRSGDYDALLREARPMRSLRERIRAHARAEDLDQIRAYMQTVASREEMAQLSWLLESLNTGHSPDELSDR
ncbi:MAG: hypothetical protein P8Z33_00010 [Gammaproteobacteria bacterium]